MERFCTWSVRGPWLPKVVPNGDSAGREVVGAELAARHAVEPVDFRLALIEALRFPAGILPRDDEHADDAPHAGGSEAPGPLRDSARPSPGDVWWPPTSSACRSTTARPAGAGAKETGIQDQPELMRRAGFTGVEGEEVRFAPALTRGGRERPSCLGRGHSVDPGAACACPLGGTGRRGRLVGGRSRARPRQASDRHELRLAQRLLPEELAGRAGPGGRGWRPAGPGRGSGTRPRSA